MTNEAMFYCVHRPSDDRLMGYGIIIGIQGQKLKKVGGTWSSRFG